MFYSLATACFALAIQSIIKSVLKNFGSLYNEIAHLKN